MRIPVATLITLAPAAGTGHRSINGGAEALGYALAVREIVRASAEAHSGALHLFMYAPLGVAAFLGHVWNRVPPTQLYDDLGAAGGYQKTFFIPA